MKKNIIYYEVALIVLLIIVDVLSKVIVVHNFLDTEVYIVDHVLGFKAVLNTEDLSYLNRVLNMNVPVSVLFIIGLVLLAITIFIYIRQYKKNRIGKLENIAFALGIAGIFCSSLDKLIYGGSWDFIYFFKWIIDIKDIYITFFCILGIALVIINVIKDIKEQIK